MGGDAYGSHIFGGAGARSGDPVVIAADTWVCLICPVDGVGTGGGVVRVTVRVWWVADIVSICMEVVKSKGGDV